LRVFNDDFLGSTMVQVVQYVVKVYSIIQ
jgi:hypothetical protein